MQRQRHQQGSLQVRSHGKRKMWVLLYRDGPTRRYVTLGAVSKLTKTQAQEKRDQHLKEVAATRRAAPDPHMTLGDFITDIALPFLQSKWKRSTAATTENRIRHHVQGDLGPFRMQELTLQQMQHFLHAKAATLSRSVVAHLRWDLHLLFKMAMAEGVIQRDPTPALYTPKEARRDPTRVLSRKEVQFYIEALDVREQIAAHLAVFTGMRPGEILALQRRHVAADCRQIKIDQRVWRGDIDDPKTHSSSRTVAVGGKTAELLQDWMQLVGDQPDAWLFTSENPLKPIWRDNLWNRNMKPRLEKVGLEWASFRELRRTHASLGHAAGIDPKVSADQRGHGIGVSLNVYTLSSLKDKANAADALEAAIWCLNE